MKQKISFFAAGMVAGLVVGFIVTNYLNRPEFAVGQEGTASASTRPAGAAPGPPSAPAANSTGAPAVSDEELARIKQQVDSRPESYEDQLMLGEYLLRIKGVAQDSLKYYARANTLKPGELKPIMGLADGHFDAAQRTDEHGHPGYDPQMLKKAAGYYERALAIDPKNVNARTDLGLTYFFGTPSDPDRAIAEYRKSLAIDPKHDKTLQNLAAALVAKGDVAAAEQTMGQLEAVAPGNPAIAQLRTSLEKVKAGEKVPTH
jgi:tetratricopeptide (TPR) repeat protein